MQIHLKSVSEPTIIETFKAFYSCFDSRSLSSLQNIYADDVVFSDPVHVIEGLDDLMKYFESMCSNLTECRFDFIDEMIGSHAAFFKWEMTYRHPSIKSNTELKILGTTYIGFTNGKVTVHDDFYDMGAMLYEHLPVVGHAIRLVKSRLRKTD